MLCFVDDQIQQLLDDDRFADITAVPMDVLRQVRQKCTVAESDVSFVRRVAQGRLDIVGHEQQRRSAEAAGKGGVAGILYDIPEILSDQIAATPTAKARRSADVLEPGEIALGLTQRLDALASASVIGNAEELDKDDLRDVTASLGEFELELSTMRRDLHTRIDAIQSEIGRRYIQGEVSVDSVLS